MIQKFSKKLSSIWAAGNIIPAEDTEIYEYGLQLVFSTIINTVIIALISAAIKLPLAWFFYLAAFVPLRITAGGYHASSHFLCTLSFTVTFSIFVFLIQRAPFFSSVLYSILCAALSYSMVLIFSPVQASNKPLTQEEAIRNRRKSLALVTLFLIPAIAAAVIPVLQGRYAAVFYSGELAASLSLTAVKLRGLVCKTT